MRRIFADVKWVPGLDHVHMKTRRAKVHLDALEREVGIWLKRPPYTIVEQDDLDKAWHYYMIGIHEAPEEIPMLVGDFVCCVRSALDQLAWNLAHLDQGRVFTRREERQINFLIFEKNDSTYAERRKLFPAAVADVLDAVQPYVRGNAYRDDPLWQLNELWSIDKHRTIPANGNDVKVSFFPLKIDFTRQSRAFDDGIVVRVPLCDVWMSPVNIKPTVEIEILFGDYLSASFEISIPRLREIYEIVANEVIPRFACFFA